MINGDIHLLIRVNRNSGVLALLLSILGVVVLLIISALFWYRWRRRRKNRKPVPYLPVETSEETPRVDPERIHSSSKERPAPVTQFPDPLINRTSGVPPSSMIVFLPVEDPPEGECVYRGKGGGKNPSSPVDEDPCAGPRPPPYWVHLLPR